MSTAFAAAVFMAMVPTLAHAYCVEPVRAANLRDEFGSLRVPVYVATGSNSTIEYLGMSKADAARIVLEVIARHNETVVAPKLVFAGFVRERLGTQELANVNSLARWPRGIVIHSFPCELLASLDVHPAFLCNADTVELLACAYQHRNDRGELVGVIPLLPPACQHAAESTIQWSFDGSTGYDLGHTLLHEIGHVLGLEHANQSAKACRDHGGVPGNDADGNTGVMRTTNGASLAMLRHWRRDDLDGFDQLYAADYPEYELAYWRDRAFPDAPAIANAASLVGTGVIRSAALADAPGGSAQPLVTLDAGRRVLFARLGADGSVVEPPAPVDPSALGVTAGSPELAVGVEDGEARVFVVWTADERPTSETMQARWALRELAGGAWTLVSGISLRTSRVSAGFDPGTGSWLLGSFSPAGEPTISIIDHDGALLLEAEPLGVTAWELGNPICGHAQLGCTMLFSSSELGGPTLGKLDFTIASDPAAVLVDGPLMFAGQDVYGRTRLARAGGGVVAGVLRGIGGWYRFELRGGFDATLEPPEPPATMLREWPLGLGAVPGAHRLALPLEVECGNGIVQSAQQCDDGDREPGDGCDELCMLELDDDGTGTGSGGDTGDSGGGVVLADESCECDLRRARDGALGWTLLCLGLGGALVRRRRPASAATGAETARRCSAARPARRSPPAGCRFDCWRG